MQLRPSACLVCNQIMIDNYASFLNCTSVSLATDFLMIPTLKLFILVCWGWTFMSVTWPIGFNVVFSFCSRVFSDVVWLCRDLELPGTRECSFDSS